MPIKEHNFSQFDIVKKEEAGVLHYSIENLQALKPEDYSPAFKNIVPNVIFGLEKFSLEGVVGVGSTWEEFGKVYYDELINLNTEISPETIQTITSLTQGVKDPIEKAANKIEKSKMVGVAIAAKIKKAKIGQIIVDRNGYKYHGRVKALTEAIRSADITI